MKTLVDVIIEKTGLHFLYKPGQQAHEGPCPFCGKGEDRFQIWHDSEHHNYWCRQCDVRGDSIDFLRTYCHMTFAEALAYLGLPDVNVHNHHNRHNHHKSHKDNGYDVHNQQRKVRNDVQSPPTEPWLAQAWPFVMECHGCLMDNVNPRALTWLQQRRLQEETLATYCIGYNPADQYVERSAWGLPPKLNEKGYPVRLLIPRGIVIPWFVDDELWGIRIRRPVGDPKYYWIQGGTTALYNAAQVQYGKPVVLVEGEFDALTIVQEAGDRVAPVATGSTHGARYARVLARLTTASTVLVAYDNDEAGEKAAAWWLSGLSNARRWRPYWSDANAMAQAGVDIGRWVAAGLAVAGITAIDEPHEEERHER